MSNVDEYIALVENFCLELGISRQMEAFRSKDYNIILNFRVTVGNWLLRTNCEACMIESNCLLICVHN